MSGRTPTRSRRSARSRAGALSLCLLLIPCLSAAVIAQDDTGEHWPASLARCEPESGGATLYGRVSERSSGLTLPGSEVRLEWRETQGVADTVRTGVQTVADDLGFYRFCGVPADVTLSLAASALGRFGSPSSLYLSRGESHREDLRVRLAAAARGAVVGWLTDTETGEPLPAAQVWIESLNVGTVADGSGRFELRELPVGGHELRIRHVGHGEQSVSVNVQPNRARHMTIALAPNPVELEPITVTVEMRPVWLEEVGFYDRKAKSLGQFMGPEWMERRKPYRFSQVLENVHGVRIAPICRPHCSYFLQSTTQATACPLTFYLDGKQLRLGSVVDLDALVPASDVAAVEVYRGISQTPAIYYGRCGSVVVWTKRG